MVRSPIPVFRKAERKKAKIKMAMLGPSGSGKTYSSLILATGLGEKVAVIDTERGSAELYSDIFNYDVAQLTPPFTPDRYITLIKEAEKNYDVIVIDSLSHAWAGEGGLLEIHDKFAKTIGNSFSAWREVSPLHNKLVDTILQSPAHIIVTMRSKQDYVIMQEDQKTIVRKVGLAPVQRDGLEYEFTIVFELTHDHLAVVSKDRTSLLASKPPFIITKETATMIKEWLEGGADIGQQISVDTAIMNELIDEIEQFNKKEDLFKWYESKKNVIESLAGAQKEMVYEKLKERKQGINATMNKKAEEVAA